MRPESRAVSIITGRVQGLILRQLTMVAWVLAGIAVVTASKWPGFTALLLIVVTPFARVLWLIFRWIQERDYVFVWLATGLLAIVALGAIITLSWEGPQ